METLHNHPHRDLLMFGPTIQAVAPEQILWTVEGSFAAPTF